MHGYSIFTLERPMLLLLALLTKHSKKKIVVSFSSCNSVKYHAELLNYINVPVLGRHVSPLICAIHLLPVIAENTESRESRSIFELINTESGIPLCTNVASKGLDISHVDWIVQFDLPDDPGTTPIRWVASPVQESRAEPFLLLESEFDFLRSLKEVRALDDSRNRIHNIQSQVSEEQNPDTCSRLNMTEIAREAPLV
ncbi:hypothetical protein OBBRIDRAFT_259484 [Obba rivulosa]|uniref:ATP-dependent RNA helicase n=1 Tax=Obba rivulosa TaxID=1052685 RepID=A0A8E2AQA3_9APHY|nr:hypothetical protein OBBRIDRAFT_259484 [Obba rivulosa]